MTVPKISIAKATTNVSPGNFNLDHFVGYTYGDPAKPILGLDGVRSHIDSGTILKASNGVITYTFLDKSHLTGLYNNPNNGFTSAFGLSVYTPAQEAAARNAIHLWDDLIPQTFRETNGQGADIVFANSLDPAQAYAYYPGTKGWKFQSDVFTNDPNAPGNPNWTNNWLTNLGYGNTTLVHELGHTLGLSHPGAYNYDPNLDLTYGNYAEYAQDSTQYTIMSYFDGGNTGERMVNWNALSCGYAQTPLLHHVYVIQQKYGADPTTRTGDTTYGFHSNAGNDLYDFSKNPYPYLTIYDAAGKHDTLDLSGFTASQFIDLHAGSFSSVGAGMPDTAAAQAYIANLISISGDPTWGPYDPVTTAAVMNSFMNANATSISRDMAYLGQPAVSGIRTSEYQNLSIAYGTHIEDAIGGSGRDLIHGNELDNILKGMAGDDVIRGYEGNDTIDGGAGKDTLTGGAGHDTFVFGNLEIGDLITDFGADDKIDLSALGPNLSFIGGSAFTGHAGEVNYVGGNLSVDTNGDKAADFSVALQAMPVVHVDQLVLHA